MCCYLGVTKRNGRDGSSEVLAYGREVFSEVQRARVVTYRPMREYGGWGVRWGVRDRSMAITVGGTRGVRVTVEGGMDLKIGSLEPERLREAIMEGAKTAGGEGVTGGG